MYHHRGEIHRKLSADPKNKDQAETHRKQAEADFERAAQLRFDPQDGEALERFCGRAGIDAMTRCTGRALA